MKNLEQNLVNAKSIGVTAVESLDSPSKPKRKSFFASLFKRSPQEDTLEPVSMPTMSELESMPARDADVFTDDDVDFSSMTSFEDMQHTSQEVGQNAANESASFLIAKSTGQETKASSFEVAEFLVDDFDLPELPAARLAKPITIVQNELDIESLQANIEKFLDVAMNIASGDFTKRGEVSNDILGNVIDAINLMVDNLVELLTDIKASANSVSVGSDVMTETTKVIVKSSKQQAMVSAKTRERVSQVSSSIQNMTNQANASAKAAVLTLRASQKGKEAVDSTLTGIQGIREEISSVAGHIASLKQRSNAISDVASSVSHISSQINLLALSAALEAAGAGEAGARFATVADEVRRLAEESANSSKQINTLIAEVRKDINAATVQVAKSSKKAEQGYEVASSAGVQLEEIAVISRQSARLAQNISKVTGVQVERVGQVDKAIAIMDRITQSSQHNVTQGQEAAQQLKRLAEKLSTSLERFRLD